MKAFMVFVTLAVHFSVAGQLQKQVYIANDDHTDFMWTGNESQYRQSFLKMLDYYIAQADSTASTPTAYQGRFNCDGTFWLWEYEKNKPAADFRKLIQKIKSGHISVPYNALVSCYGANNTEGILRGMYYGGYLQRKYDIPLTEAVAMENQTLPLGLAALWAGSGAKYSWKGVCNCATKQQDLTKRNKEIYWYQGPDSSRVLMKWYSNTSKDNTHLGGYAEARNPAVAVDELSALCTSSNYPYHIAGAFGKGWDDLETLTDIFITTARKKTTATTQVTVSNHTDFFKAFEKEYGRDLPSETVSYGNEWDLYSASMAELSARVKRSIEKLRAAEAMASLISLQDNYFGWELTEMRSKAWMALGLYYEHNWTADGPVTRAERANWQRRIEGQLSGYADSLYNMAGKQLGNLVKGKKGSLRFYAFNALSWERTGVCDFPYTGPTNVKVTDITTNKEVPSQFIIQKGRQFIRVLASAIPSLGYKVFEIQPGQPAEATPAAVWNNPVFENDFYKITLTKQGVITSLVDKVNGNRECVTKVNGKFMNDLGSGNDNNGTIAIENDGPVSTSVLCTGTYPIAHTSRITLYHQIPRIDIENQITRNFGEVLSWAFSYNIPKSSTWHEELGAVLQAKTVTEGGNYATRNARFDWLTLNHFADINNGDYGITLSNADCAFMKTGNSALTTLDTETPQISILAGGQVDGKDLGIPLQGGDSLFTQRFAIGTHQQYNAAASMRFSLEHQNPLVAGTVNGSKASYPEMNYSFLTISDPDVLLWSLKPAEDGPENGLIARVWNFAAANKNVTLSFKQPLEAAWQATHVETDLGKATVVKGNLQEQVGHHQIKTFRLKFFK